jgi:carbamate kinase
MIEVDRADPAFDDPTKPIGPLYDAAEASRLEAEKGWAFKPDGDSLRRVVPSPPPKRIFEIEAIKRLLEAGASSSARAAAGSRRRTPTSRCRQAGGSSGSRR